MAWMMGFSFGLICQLSVFPEMITDTWFELKSILLLLFLVGAGRCRPPAAVYSYRGSVASRFIFHIKITAITYKINTN